MKAYLTIVIILFNLYSYSQEVKVRGKFLEDSVKIGNPVAYSLSASYPSKLQVLFPDSLNNFKPFEYDRRNYFPTITKNGLSYDSAVYWVSSFEIDRIQYLSIPVLQLSEGDTLFYRPLIDSVFLALSSKAVPENIPPAELPLKSDTAYRTVDLLFNYPAFITAIGITVAMLIAVWIIFGKRIRQWWQRRKLMKGFKEFEESFQQIIENIRKSGGIKEAEEAIRLWKRYLEDLADIPYTKYTTREIAALEKHEEIREALQDIDRRIYGRKKSDQVAEYYTLKSFSEDQYLKKLEELNK